MGPLPPLGCPCSQGQLIGVSPRSQSFSSATVSLESQAENSEVVFFWVLASHSMIARH